ncbi:MAG: radical SAM protein [Desulfobacterales bacterium]|nr:radical SAM protein [Desulfobacterales bacterium]
MKKNTVLFIANDHPLDSDTSIRRKMANAEARAARQAPRFPGLDLVGLQKGVHRNLAGLQLLLDGKYMGLLDLLNYIKNDRTIIRLTPENAAAHLSLANIVTLNGIYFHQYLSKNGYLPIIIQNYSLCDLSVALIDKPLAVCISSNFVYLDEIREMAAVIKEHAPDTPVIVGGMLVKKVLDAGNDLSAQTLKWLSGFFGMVDYFVIEAQGEQTLIRLLDSLKNGRDPAATPNLAYFDGQGQIHFTPREQEDLAMDHTAISWEKIPARYMRPTIPVNTSRGCHYRCRFCTYHRLFPKVHYKSLDVLREELRSLARLGFIRHVRFTDDNFTANPARLKTVLNMMIEEQFDFAWSAYARANTISPDLVRLMKDSGCEFLDMGLESGSQTILDSMDKRLTRNQIIEAVRLLNSHHIYCEGGFVVGYTGETLATFDETVDMIKKSGLPYYHPYLFYFSKDMLVNEEKDVFGLRGLGRAWTQNTMDSITASGLMADMLMRIESSFTDGETSIWEAFKLLRAEGYDPDDIFSLFRLKRELQLALRETGGKTGSPKVEKILGHMEGLLKD